MRLWSIDRPEPRFVETADLLAFAERNRLPALAREIERLVARAPRPRTDARA